MKAKPIIKLKLGWEEAMMTLLKPHSRTCKCGCIQASKTFKARVKELTKMIAKGEAVII